MKKIWRLKDGTELPDDIRDVKLTDSLDRKDHESTETFMKDIQDAYNEHKENN